MKKIIIITLGLLLLSGVIYASTNITLADSTPSRWVAYSGSGYISHITLVSAGDIRVTINDTSTNTAVLATTKPILMVGNIKSDSDKLDFSPNAGSYIYFSKGLQITSSGAIDFLSINVRSANGAGGTNYTLYDTTPSRVVMFATSGWISDIAVMNSQACEVTIYDTNTTAAATSFTGQPVFQNYYEPGIDGDTNVLKLYSLPAGSYIYLDYGAQVTASAEVWFLWINKRNSNGAN